MFGIFGQRFDPAAKGDLAKADETLRDAVWTRLTGGGIGLPGFAAGIAAYLVTQPPPGPGSAIQAVQGLTDLGIKSQSLPTDAATRVLGFIAVTRDELRVAGALRDRCGTEVFALPSGGLFDLGGWSRDLAACGNHQASVILVVGALLLTLLWTATVLQPYIHGPQHITMPPRGLLWSILGGACGFVWLVVYWLLH